MTATTMDAECRHGELVGMPCPPCDRTRTATHATPEAPGGWTTPFQANYAGTCGGCEFPIDPAQMIRGRAVDVTGELREYRHDGVCVGAKAARS